MPTPTLSRPSFRLNTGINSGQDSAAVAGLSDGRFVAVWRDLGAGGLGTLKYAIFNADGTVAVSEAIANQNTPGVIDQGDVAVAALTGGGFAITWSSRLNQNDIFHRVFNNSGAAVTGDLTSNIGATLGDQRHPDIVGDGAGGFHVVWEDTAAVPNVQLRHFDGTTGQPTGSATGLSDLVGGDEVPAIAINRAGSQFAVVWDDDLGQTPGGNEDSIRGFLQGGGGEFRIDSGDVHEFHGTPDVAYSTGNNFMAVWSEFITPLGPYQVNGRINGGIEFKINTSPHVNSTTMPSVVGLQSGNFLVVWNDGSFEGSSNYDVLGQLFAVDGAKIGSEFVVSDFSSSSIARIEASELLDGRVLVTWDPNKLGQTVGPDVFARIVDPRQVPANWLGTSAHEQYVGTSFADVLNGADGNDRLWGEAGDDQMTGGAGDDTLIGGLGQDSLIGGLGNDVYVLENGADGIIDNGGIDTATSTISRSIAYLTTVDNLTLLNLAGALTGTGNSLANIITGNNFNNTLNGAAGGDNLRGLGGNDTYVVDSAYDIVNEQLAGSSGTDRVLSSITFNLGNITDALGAVEDLTLLGTANIFGTGNNLANLIYGNAGSNKLDGGLGNDTLRGLAGNDILIGNAGRDTLTGGLGNDTFGFAIAAHSPTGAGADVITDFDDYGDDRIDLSTVYGGVLAYRHNLAFTAAGQLRINDIAGADVLVEVNTGGTLAADMHIRLNGTALASMASSDFFL